MATTTPAELRDRVRGETITPGDLEYEDARRVYNAMIDRRPKVVVRPLGADDIVVSAEVVTADARRVTASESESEDLFWALRGGGGNFGVVTAFEYRLHPVEQVYGGPILYELDDAATVLKFYRDFIKDAPRELGGFAA